MKEHYITLDIVEMNNDVECKLNAAYEAGYKIVSHHLVGIHHYFVMELVFPETVQ